MPTIIGNRKNKKGGNVSEFNVLEQIKKLVKLQEGDTGLYNLRKELEERPLKIKELQQQFEVQKTQLNQLEADFKKIQVERSTLEGDLAQKEDAVKKAETQLSQIKTNKEYTAKIGEIEGLKADKSIMEEKILGTYDRADEVKAKIDQEREAVAAEEARFLEQKQTIEAEIKELEAKISEIEAGRQALLDGVDKQLLARYERILNNRDGLAVVPVVGDSCGGCFMNLPPQMVNEIRKQKELITCEICARILYLEEDLNSETA